MRCARLSATAILLSFSGVIPALAQGHAWETYADARGTRIEYPADVFPMARDVGEDGVGQVFTTRDGRARLQMYSIPNSQALSPEQFMRNQFPVPRSTLTYDRVTPTFFAISSRRKGMIVYLRCNFSSNAGGSLHCVDLRYPVNEKRAWDAIVTRVSLSVRPRP